MPTPPSGRRNVVAGVLAAVAVFVVSVSFQAVVVHDSFDGNYTGAFLPAQLFGLPEAEREAGLAPVVHGQEAGWDGQFYYHLSNDPLLRRDTAKHFDAPVYRGQRIGFPILAYAASRVLGYPITPPRLYLTLQWAVVAAGFGALVWWLGANGVPRLYAVVWGLAFGVLHPTAHGLPDGVADAWLIFSLITLHRRRLGLYCLFATLMLLTREGYAAFAGGVWLATALRLARFSDAGYVRRVFLCSVPLLAMLGWTAYVSFATGLPPNHGRTGSNMLDKPLMAAYKFTLKNFADNEHTEIVWRLVYAFALVVVTCRAVRFARANPAVGAALPYLALTMTLGAMVWENYTGYPKAMTGVLVIGLFLLPLDRSLLLRFALAASFVCGLEMLYHTRFKHPWLYSAKMAETLAPPPAYTGPPAAPLTDFRSTAEWTEPTATVEIRGTTVWKFARREVVPFRLTLTNLSDATWPPTPQGGPLCIHIGCKIYHADDGHLMHVVTAPLDRPVPPGETVRATVCIPLRRGRYTVVVSGVQHTHRWFHEADPKFGARYDIEVK